MHTFAPPDGIVTVQIDPATGQLASASCPTTQTEVFIAGVQPTEVCRVHGGGATTLVASWEETPPQPASKAGAAPKLRAAAKPPETAKPPQAQAQEPKKEKRGFFRRMLDVFK